MITDSLRTYGDPCGIARALDVVGERWALLIVRELLLGPKRFGQLQRDLTGASPNVLSQRLRDLEKAQVVRRRKLEPPASLIVYELTRRGAELEPVLLALGRWGSALDGRAGNMSPDAMAIALKAVCTPAAGPVPVTYQLEIDGEPYVIAIGTHGADVRRGRTAEADAGITTNQAALRLVTFMGGGIHASEEAGALTITGSRRVAMRFTKYFVRP